MIALRPSAQRGILDATRRDTPAESETLAELDDSFARLTSRELDRAYRLAGLILGDAAEAEDAVGEAFERAWSRAGQLRDPARFQAWIDRIVVNVCRDRLRRRRRVRFIELDASHESRAAADPFQRVLDADEAVRSMANLTPDEPIVIVLHFWADLTLDAIAERLGWRTGTVRSRLHRSLQRMRADLARGPADGHR